MKIEEILRLSPVIPILTIDSIEDAIPLATALVRGGLRVIEITLRTPIAFEAIREIATQLPSAILGIGTVTSPNDFIKGADAGAKFAISPGFTEELNSAAILPWLPGVATPKEIMIASQAGHNILKFFPANQYGGVSTLRAFSEPFSNVMFCPTGGVTQETAPNYLALSNVISVCGSWLAPRSSIIAGNWEDIYQHARATSSFTKKKDSNTFPT